eukprot:CAMPEP_0194369912 /NCGR_PEP_ID=MMETSP0174-20130528/18292_1 /TAXON_ID=216777 /ORGANISM="Proboscia alata, Strain PI-D3" /LENGTH=34 /DNA_ID= /DNA_START= /DNA_END= /DNA_ORIENTATION=
MSIDNTSKATSKDLTSDDGLNKLSNKSTGCGDLA